MTRTRRLGRARRDSAGGFSLELSEELRDMRDWVHDFAATVIGPAGAEWDEPGSPRP